MLHKKMNSKTYWIIIGVIVILALAGAIFYFSSSPSSDQNLSDKNYIPIQQSLNQVQTAAPIGDPQPAVNSQSQTKVKEILFTDSGFSPSSMTVKAGDTVKFVNQSSEDFWPASAKHPTHDVYPVKGGCMASIFDACKAILPGGNWGFKFDVVGSWNYHDHLHPIFFGKVNVQ